MADYGKSYGGGYYKKKAMKFEQLNPESLADLYTNRPSRKRVVIDTLLATLDEMHRDVLEQVVEMKEKEGFKEANEVIKHIKNALPPL